MNKAIKFLKGNISFLFVFLVIALLFLVALFLIQFVRDPSPQGFIYSLFLVLCTVASTLFVAEIEEALNTVFAKHQLLMELETAYQRNAQIAHKNDHVGKSNKGLIYDSVVNNIKLITK